MRRIAPLAPALLCALVFALVPAHNCRAAVGGPVVQAVRSAGPAVVNISTTGVVRRSISTGDPMMDRFFQEMFRPVERRATTLGSGVIIDGKRGLIVTNAHVVAEASSIKVQLADRRVFEAEVVGIDPESDVALLRIHTKDRLPQAALAKDRPLMIGETVVAIGNPFGLQHTVTAGVISALGRRVPVGPEEWLSGLIQTDASINPGNSGGPLVDTDGRVVGINTAIFQRAQGIGFAVPAGRVGRVVQALLAGGPPPPMWIGVKAQDLTPELARAFDLTTTTGVLVKGVEPDGPAAAAGLSRGMVVLAVDGQPILDRLALMDAVDQTPPDGKIQLECTDGYKTTLFMVRPEAVPATAARRMAWERLGLSVGPMKAEDARAHDAPPGSAVVIEQVRPGSPCAAIGLRQGDLLRALCGRAVASPAQFDTQMARCRFVDVLSVTAQRGRVTRTIRLKE